MKKTIKKYHLKKQVKDRIKAFFIIILIYILFVLYLLFVSYRVETLDNKQKEEQTQTTEKNK